MRNDICLNEDISFVEHISVSRLWFFLYYIILYIIEVYAVIYRHFCTFSSPSHFSDTHIIFLGLLMSG